MQTPASQRIWLLVSALTVIVPDASLTLILVGGVVKTPPPEIYPHSDLEETNPIPLRCSERYEGNTKACQRLSHQSPPHEI